MQDKIRTVLASAAKLSVPSSSVADMDSLHALGLTSLSTVSLMLALEDAFEVEFPDRLLCAETFASVGSIASAIRSLRPGLNQPSS